MISIIKIATVDYNKNHFSQKAPCYFYVCALFYVSALLCLHYCAFSSTSRLLLNLAPIKYLILNRKTENFPRAKYRFQRRFWN